MHSVSSASHPRIQDIIRVLVSTVFSEPFAARAAADSDLPLCSSLTPDNLNNNAHLSKLDDSLFTCS